MNLRLTFHTACVITAAMLLAIGFGLYVWLDIATHSMFYSLSVTGMFAAFFAVPALLLLWRAPLRVKFTFISIFLLAMLVARNFEWNTRKEFLRDLGTVQMGMTQAQVENILRAYFKNRASSQHTVVFRHTDEGWGNADAGVVTFANGRVASVEFLGD